VKSSLSARTLALAGGLAVALVAAAAWLLMSIPTVAVLGNRVKLPLVHGGSTWVDLMVFALMGIAAVAYLVTRDERIYAWQAGFRALAAPLWVVNAVLGFIAAMSTWDFSASQQSPMSVALQDPRLVAQMLLLAGVAVLVLADWLVLEKRSHKAWLDIGFTVLMTVVMANIFLDPMKRALHPDSPVLNSGWEIKGPFFGMVAAIFALAMVLSWVASSFVPRIAPIGASDER
jgi:uncharacterized membrane protein SirB2